MSDPRQDSPFSETPPAREPVEPTPPAVETDPVGVPWETRLSEDPLGATWDSWRESMFNPDAFFRALPPRGSFLPAIGYLVLLSVIGAFFSLMWSLVFSGVAVRAGAAAEAGLSPVAEAFLTFFITPFAAVLGVFLIGGLYHLLLMLMDGAGGGYRGTVRVLCYSAGPAVFGIVPILGSVVGTVWWVVLAIVGLRNVHRIETWKAAVAVLVPVVLLVLLTVLAVIAAVAIGLMVL